MGSCFGKEKSPKPPEHAIEAPRPSHDRYQQASPVESRLARKVKEALPRSESLQLPDSASKVVLTDCAHSQGHFLCAFDKTLSMRTVQQILCLTDDAHQRNINALAYLPEAARAISAGQDKLVKLWQPDFTEAALQQQHSWRAHDLPIMAATPSLSEKLLATGSRDYAVKVWDLETNEELAANKIDRNIVTALKWLDDETLLQCSEDLNLRVLDLRTGAIEIELEVSRSSTCGTTFALSCDVNPARPYEVVTGHTGFNSAGCVVQGWDIRQWGAKGGASEVVWRSANNSAKVTKVQYYSEGERVVAASMDSSLSVLDGASGRLVGKWQNPVEMMTGFQSAAVLSGGDVVVGATIEPKLKVFSLGAGGLVEEF